MYKLMVNCKTGRVERVPLSESERLEREEAARAHEALEEEESRKEEGKSTAKESLKNVDRKALGKTPEGVAILALIDALGL